MDATRANHEENAKKEDTRDGQPGSKGKTQFCKETNTEDGDGGENVTEKVNSRSFNLHSDYSKSLTLSNVGEPS